MFRLLATAFLFTLLMKYSVFSTLLLPVQSHRYEHTSCRSEDSGGEMHVNVCARYALSIAYALGVLCGTLQYFTKLILNKVMRKSYHNLCDLISIGGSFLATGMYETDCIILV